MSSSNQSSEAPTPMQSAISDLAKQISHLAVAQADSGVQQEDEITCEYGLLEEKSYLNAQHAVLGWREMNCE